MSFIIHGYVIDITMDKVIYFLIRETEVVETFNSGLPDADFFPYIFKFFRMDLQHLLILHLIQIMIPPIIIQLPDLLFKLVLPAMQ